MKRALLPAAAAVAALALAAPPHARAGTYDLLACDAMPNHSFGAWQMEPATANGTMAVYASDCDGDPAKVNNMDGNGLISRSGYDYAWTNWNDGRGWRMQPAPGTKILGLTWAGTLHRTGTPSGTEGWTTEMADTGNGGAYLACPPGTASCTYNYPSPAWFPLPNGAPGTGIRVGSYCRPALPAACWNPRTTLFFNSAAAALARTRYASVRVQDTSVPSLTLSGGGLTGGGWLRGTQDVSYASSDNSGVRTNRLYVDGTQQGADTQRACDFTDSVPCPASLTDRYTTSTATLADGSHTFRVETVDAAGNVNGDTETFSVDNHAPAAPEDVSADGGGTAATPAFTVRFRNPVGQAAPIAKAHYTVCESDVCHGGTTSTTNGASGAEDSISGSFGIDQPGSYTVKIWLEDAAGNADPANASAPIRLELADAHGGFRDRSSSTATFTAASSFDGVCPHEATLTAMSSTTVEQGAKLIFDLPPAGTCTVLSAELHAGSQTFDVLDQVRDIYRYGNSGLVIHGASGDSGGAQLMLTFG